MGCGSSASGETDAGGTQAPNQQQLKQMQGLIGVGDDFGNGNWWWGHPNGSKFNPDPPSAVEKGATALLPAYLRDMLRWRAQTSYLDYVWKTKGNKKDLSCPFAGAIAHLGHAEVTKLLAECPHQHLKGEISRGNDLGFLSLSEKAYPRFGTIGLGVDVDKHRIARGGLLKLIPRIPGSSGIMKDMMKWLAGKKKVAFPGDIDNWWCRFLWRHVLRKELSIDEAGKFLAFRDQWLAAAVVHINEFSIANLTFTMDDLHRDQERYRKEIEGLLQDSDIEENIRGDVAQAVMEMFVFAGGLSVPQAITSAIASLFQGFLKEPLTEANVMEFVYESTRLFPAVQGFTFYSKDKTRHVCSLNTSQRDPKVWGPDADKFTLKGIKLYQEKHIGFAQPAAAENPADSKYCPAIYVALGATRAAVLAFNEWAKGDQRIESIWRPQEKIEPAGLTAWWKPFVLERVQNQEKDFFEDWMDRDHSGEQLLADLGPAELSAVMTKIDKDKDSVPDKLKLMDAAARLFYSSIQGGWMDRSRISEIDLPREPALGAYTDENSVLLPWGGIRLPNEDEQWGGFPFFTRVAFFFMKIVNSFQDDKIAEELYIRNEEQRKEAVAIVQRAFDRGPGKASYLPVVKTPWTDFTSDKAQGLWARYGPGQLFLRPNKDQARSEFGELACDTELLGKFAVRPDFERMGTIAYFKVDKQSGEFALSAIDWMHGNKLVRPGDDDWEHAKFVYRCSTGTFMTAVHHLTWCHWVQANALSTSIREAFSPDHPIRRVMWVNQYNTAYVNGTSLPALKAENGILHRISAFTYDSLTAIFKYALEEGFEYKTLPQQFEKSELPTEIKSKLPMYEDGLEVWNALRVFFDKYISLYYADDAAVKADPQIVEYWKFKSVPPYRKGLPELSKSNLVDQLTQACFDVCAFHELVGSVTFFITDPTGGFFQVRKGSNMADLQNMIQSLCLAATTAYPMPTYMSEWSHMLDLGPSAKVNKFKEAAELWKAMQKSLEDVSKAMETRNKSRAIPFKQYDPKFFECSVSL